MQRTRKEISAAAGLVLAALFALCVFCCLSGAASAYAGISSTLQAQYEGRTVLGYAAGRVRACDQAGCVTLGKLGEVPALELWEYGDSYTAVTYIYCYEGQVMELYASADQEFGPEAGVPVVAAQALDFSLEGRLLKITCRTDSGTEQTYVCLNSEEGAGT